MRAAPAGRAGGRAWLIWALGASCFGFAFFQRVAPSVMVAELMRDFAVGAAVLGNLSAIYFYAYASLQIPVGVLLDHWGPRRMLAVAISVAAAGNLLFALSDDIALAYLGRLLIGAGSAVGFVGTLKLISHWFPTGRFAFLTGMTMLVGMIGGVGGQAPMAAVVGAVGWRGTLIATGVFGALLAAAVAVVVRDRPPGMPAADAGGLRLLGLAADLRQVLASRQNWIIALYSGAMSAPMLSYGALWGVPHMMKAYGLSRPAAAGAASMVLLGWAAGAPLAGWVSDRMARRRPVMVVGACAALVLWPVQLYLPGLPLAASWVVLFAIGAVSASMIVSMAAARELAAPHVIGGTTGFANAAAVGAGALLQPVVGLLLDAQWDGTMAAGARVYSLAAWDGAMLTMPAAAGLAVASAFFIRETYARPRTE